MMRAFLGGHISITKNLLQAKHLGLKKKRKKQWLSAKSAVPSNKKNATLIVESKGENLSNEI